MTPEAKRRKNQKKKQKQKQKKQAERQVSEEPVIERSLDDSVESVDEMSQSVEESEMNTTITTTAPLEDDTNQGNLADCKGSPENLQLIRSLQLDAGTNIGVQLEKKLSNEVTIIDDIPSNESQDDVNVMEADHNVAVPQAKAPQEVDPPIETAIEQESDVVEAQSTETDHASIEQESDVVEAQSKGTDHASIDPEVADPQPDNQVHQSNVESAAISNYEADSETKSKGPFQAIEHENAPQIFVEPTLEDDQSLVIEHGSTVEDTVQQVPAPSNGEEESARVIPDIDSTQPLNDGSAQVTDLFDDNNDSAGELMPWEMQDEGVSSSKNLPSEDKQVVDLFGGDDKNNEVMPWETSTGGQDSEHHNASTDSTFAKPVVEESTPFNDQLFEQNHENSEKKVESTSVDEIAQANDFHQPVFDEESDDTVSKIHAPSTEHQDPQHFETRKHIQSPEMGLESAEPEDVSKQEQDKLAAIFGDDEAEESSFWLNENPQHDEGSEVSHAPQSESQPSEQAPGKPEAKFSFLQEDDDLLDEDEGDLLPSDEEVPSQISTKVSADADSTPFVALSNEPSNQRIEATVFAPSVASVPANGHTSRYEPTQQSNEQNRVSAFAGHNFSPQYGIATPQFALQSNVPAQTQNVGGSQETVEKINQEKKKSDAYDFPLDLFPEKKKILHAKPVRVPTLAVASQQVPNRVAPTQGLNDAQRSSGNRATVEVPLPKNPYASLVTPKSTVPTGSQIPVHGAVPPNTVLPSIPSTGPVQNPPQFAGSQYPAMSSYMPTSRSRGYSNASVGGLSSKSSERSTPITTAIPFPSASRKTSAAKYAPTSPSQGPHSYATGRGKVNGLPVNQPVPYGGLPSANAQVNQPPVPYGGLPTANAQGNQPAIPYGGLPTANTQGNQSAIPYGGLPTANTQGNQPPIPYGGLPSANTQVNQPPLPYGGLPSANAQVNQPPVPYGGLPSANAQGGQPPILHGGLPNVNAHAHANQKTRAMPPALDVSDPMPPSNVLSPTSASSTRRFHARSNSSVYTPNQNEYTSKYAPTVHPQYQNTFPGQDMNIPHATRKNTRSGSLIGQTVQEASGFDAPVDNQALLHRQFPLISWSATDKVVYGVPTESPSNSYVMGPGSSLQCLEVTQLDSKIAGSSILKSFPGPLIKNKTKKKDIEKWLETGLADYAESTLEYTILAILKLKLADSIDWKEISRCLYNSDELSSFVCQPLIDSKPKPMTPKLDANAQLRVLACLQTGGRDQALAIAMEKGDYAMSLLIGSLMGKDKWAEVVQTYLDNEFRVDSDASHFSTNLLSLVFQVFIGNSKTAIQGFYTDRSKSQWATENWRIIVAAVLSNIQPESENPAGSGVPPLINEFLVEYGVFLNQRGLGAEACIVFMLANLPLSSSPIASTIATFEQIGGPMSLESCVFSELYEFLSCPDAKGYQCLHSQKLYHAFCLQEHGLFSAASRYADYLTGTLKQIPKKDPVAMHIAHGLNELSNRLASSSTGWLGKPTFSSVWGQIDKSFNKYIGGDDDTLIKNQQEKKVFDGFTPVASRNSSMLNVNQYQFTPAHKQPQPLGFNEDLNPPVAVAANPMDISTQGLTNKYTLSKSLTEQGPPPTMSSYSVNSSPKQPAYRGLHSNVSPAHFPLRRVQTEQMGGITPLDRRPPAANSKQVATEETQSTKDSFSLHSSNAIAPPVSISRVSPHHSSTPDLLRKRSLALSDCSGPAEPRLEQAHYSNPSFKLPYANSVPDSSLNQPSDRTLQEDSGVETQKQASNGGISYKQENYSQVSITGFEKMIEGTYGSNGISQPQSQVQPELAARRSTANNDRHLIDDGNNTFGDEASTSVLHNDIYQRSSAVIDAQTSEPSSEAILNAGLGSADSGNNVEYSTRNNLIVTDYQKIDASPVAADIPDNTSFEKNEPIENRRAESDDKTESFMDNIPTTGTPFLPEQKENHLVSNTLNPYAPSLASRKLSAHVPSIDGPAKTNVYAIKEQANDVNQRHNLGEPLVTTLPGVAPSADRASPAVTSPVTSPQAMPPQIISPKIMSLPVVSPSSGMAASSAPVNRFDPIKPPAALTADVFEPVIKKAAASRAFTPLVVQSPEDQYDDIVEDESDDEEEEEQQRQKEREEQERRKKEEEEKKRKEKEKLEAKKAKQKEDEKTNGWFGWLKKDPNEKKPIKAKLGHKKSTFYYDEKLKRWVNKDASEEEKEKIASPPPPPPVVKRMDNGPKTKPLPNLDVPTKETVGPILPNNPITGAPLGPSLATSAGAGDALPMPNAPMNHPGINLSGKKANGLDDLLSLTGNNGTASRRKRKPGRGYVNVMDNK